MQQHLLTQRTQQDLRKLHQQQETEQQLLRHQQHHQLGYLKQQQQVQLQQQRLRPKSRTTAGWRVRRYRCGGGCVKGST